MSLGSAAGELSDDLTWIPPWAPGESRRSGGWRARRRRSSPRRRCGSGSSRRKRPASARRPRPPHSRSRTRREACNRARSRTGHGRAVRRIVLPRKESSARTRPRGREAGRWGRGALAVSASSARARSCTRVAPAGMPRGATGEPSGAGIGGCCLLCSSARSQSPLDVESLTSRGRRGRLGRGQQIFPPPVGDDLVRLAELLQPPEHAFRARVVEVVDLDHGRDGTRTLGLCVQPSVIAATSSELGSSFHPYPAPKDSCGFRPGIPRYTTTPPCSADC